MFNAVRKDKSENGYNWLENIIVQTKVLQTMTDLFLYVLSSGGPPITHILKLIPFNLNSTSELLKKKKKNKQTLNLGRTEKYYGTICPWYKKDRNLDYTNLW